MTKSQSIKTVWRRVISSVVMLALIFVLPKIAGGVPDRACCVQTNELQEIGLCMSGPGGLQRPIDCGEAGRCYMAVGGGVSTSNPDGSWAVNAAGLIALPGYCSSDFQADNIQGTPRGGSEIDLFSVFDADQDGDLDLKDISVFLETYEPAPFRVE